MQSNIVIIPPGGELSLPVDSAAFACGTGLFETLKLSAGILYFFERHWRRLCDSAAYMGLRVSAREDEVLAAVRELVKVAALSTGVIKISLLATGERPLLAVYSRPLAVVPEGATRLCLSPARRNPDSLLVTHKTHNYAENQGLVAEARAAGFRDCLLLNTAGKVAECASSNLFWFTDDVLYTPAVEMGLLPGVVRAVVLEAAAENGIAYQTGGYDLDHLRAAQCLWLTSSIQGVVPVDEFIDAEGTTAFNARHPLGDAVLAGYHAAESESAIAV